MTTAMSKRNQARNERALQELLKTVPGNDRCADCSARNPGWASWSLGIFLCMRCAAIHRKLGTHISKVKSLSMDSWSNEHVENMKSIGNVKSNQLYNPRGKAPIVPIDQDEVDGAVEWFIKQKYVEKTFQEGSSNSRVQQIRRNQTFDDHDREHVESPGSPSIEDEEPHLPASRKSGKRFGFGLRSASSTFGLSRKNRERKSSLPAGKVVGAAFGVKEEGLELKLVQLKEMGFPDEKRNAEVLRGMNGDLERAIESLVRLGQGQPRPGLAKKVSTTFSSGATKPERTPKPAPFNPSENGGFGASFQQSPQSTGFGAAQSSASSPGYRKPSHNPFDVGSSQAAQSSQSNIEQAFNNMSIAQPVSSQSTGILPSQQNTQHQVYQQSMTPPPSNMQLPYGYNPYLQQQQQEQQQQPLQPQATGYNPYFQNQQQQQPLQPQATGYNPYLQNQQLQIQQPNSNPFMAQQMQPQMTSNPFMQAQQVQSPTSNPFMQQQAGGAAYNSTAQYQQPIQFSQQVATSSPVSYQNSQGNNLFEAQQLQAQQQQSQQQFQQQPQQLHKNSASNPYMQQQQQYSQPQTPTQFQPNLYGHIQPLTSQPTGRMNKQSILALYNMQPSIPEHPEQQPQPQAPQRSVTIPASMNVGSNNPFGTALPGAGAPAAGTPRVRDSIFAGTDDPFASLSAKIR